METFEKPFSCSSYLAGFVVLDAFGEQDTDPLSSALVSMDPWRVLGYSEGGIRAYLLRTDPALHRYVVRRDGTLAGAVFLRHPWLLGPYIELFAIFPEYQGSGTGRAVVDWMGEESRPFSRNLWALVSSFNTGARIFYRRMGFIELAPLADLVKPGCDEILIRKILKPR